MTDETATPTPDETPDQGSQPTPRPARPQAPSPAALAARRPRPQAPVAPALPPSDSAKHGRVGDDGTVYVRDGGEERAVGSYPGASADEALHYFARKFDELYASAELLVQRLANPDVGGKEIADGLSTLREHIGEAHVVGDLAALRSRVEQIEAGLAAKRESEAAQRAQAKAAAATEREAIVAEAEQIAAQPPGSTQWKTSGERMRVLLDDWKRHQRSAARLDKTTETALWQRFSHARNAFDKNRRAWFAQLDSTRADAKATKDALVREAEQLATSTDWGPTARAFKRLMDQWRQAGRAARSDDDALWERFKTAQDAFFNAKDEVSAAEDEEFRANLAVKEALIVEAEAILPVRDLDAAKTRLRGIQERWDAAGKVPRADIERTEKALRRVESAVRDADEARWKATNPEVAARATSMALQLQESIAGLQADLEQARATGNERKVGELQAKIDTQQQWLDQARAGLDEFS